MRIYREITNDRGYVKKAYARDNNAEYILTSAMAHDMVTDYEDRYHDHPTAKWYNRHFRFERVK